MTGTMLLFAASAFGFWILSLRFLREGRQPGLGRRTENAFSPD